MSIEEAVLAACLLEVTARKVGNVHPLASFADCDWGAFAASAEAIAPVLGGAATRPLGETILRAVEATRERVGRNTNLGIILLLAPLAAVPDGRRPTPSFVSEIVGRTTVDDCARVYDAIRLAAPGGLGKAAREDVESPPAVPLYKAMHLAAERDDVAKQYAFDFEDVFALAAEFTGRSLPVIEGQIASAHLYRLAAASDTLIRRKCGPDMATETRLLARAAAERGGHSSLEGRRRLASFDAFLRADGNRRNPGTTADLIAAALFVAVRLEQVPCFPAADITRYADEIRRSGRILPESASR